MIATNPVMSPSDSKPSTKTTTTPRAIAVKRPTTAGGSVTSVSWASRCSTASSFRWSASTSVVAICTARDDPLLSRATSDAPPPHQKARTRSSTSSSYGTDHLDLAVWRRVSGSRSAGSRASTHHTPSRSRTTSDVGRVVATTSVSSNGMTGIGAARRIACSRRARLGCDEPCSSSELQRRGMRPAMASFVSPLMSAWGSSHSASARTSLSVSCAL